MERVEGQLRTRRGPALRMSVRVGSRAGEYHCKSFLANEELPSQPCEFSQTVVSYRQPMTAPPPRDTPWILGVGLLDTLAYVLNNYGMQHEQTSVVSVLASLYGAFTVALAAVLLRESVSRSQWFGIAAIFAGIVLISR